jgi:hypothetical protein
MTRNGIGNVERYMKPQVGMGAVPGPTENPAFGREKVSALVFGAVDADVSQAAELRHGGTYPRR